MLGGVSWTWLFIGMLIALFGLPFVSRILGR